MRLKVHRDIQIGSVVHPPGSTVEIRNKELCRKLLHAKLATKASRLSVLANEEGLDDPDEDEGVDEAGDEEVETTAKLPAPKRPKKRSGDPDLHARLDELETF